MSKKRILVTGGTGFLGSSIIKALVRQGHEVTVLVRASSNTFRLSGLGGICRIADAAGSLEDILRSEGTEMVIHTAASYGRKGESDDEIRWANIGFPANLLDAARRTGVSSFINTHTSLPAAANLYAATKHEFLALLSAGQAGLMDIVNVVPEYFFGPGDDSWKFITMVFTRIAEKASSIPLSSGDQKRDFIYIDDVVSAYCLLVNKGTSSPSFRSYPVGSGFALSIRDLVEECGNVAGNKETNFQFGAMPSRQADADIVPCDTSALAELGWKCETTLRDGLERTWNHIKQDILKYGSEN